MRLPRSRVEIKQSTAKLEVMTQVCAFQGDILSYYQQLKASRAIGAKNYDAAIDVCKNMLDENEEDYFAISILAFCYEWKGDIAQAIIYADRLLARFPNNLNMLMLSARYWSESGDEERTYQFACRAIENASQPMAEIPKWCFWLVKPLSVFKQFRGLEAKAMTETQTDEKYRADHLNWAKKYKVWYESKQAHQ